MLSETARRQQITYQVSAIAATTGVSALAILATYYKFSRHMTGPDSPFPWLDMAGTLMLVVGGVAGMEMWARWAHKVLWHDFQPGWALHKSHHVPRVGPFEVCMMVAAAVVSAGSRTSALLTSQLCWLV
jgi:beta-carotene 3-hydroxylase